MRAVMRPMALLALAAPLFAASVGVAGAGMFLPPPGILYGDRIVAAKNMPNREGNHDPRGYDGTWWGHPTPYWGYPAPRETYYVEGWCRQMGDYDPRTGIVVETSGARWQCGIPPDMRGR